MTNSSSPRRWARGIGLLYLIVIIGGGFAEAFVRQKLLVPGDAAATAANILANEELYRIGFVADLVPLLCNVALAILFYGLFKVVNKPVAALAILFSLIGTAVQGAVLLLHLMPLMLLAPGPALSAIPVEQLQALAYLSFRLQANGYNIALAFFGCFGLCLGWLIFTAGFMPRILGVLMGIAGFCYFTNAMLGFLAPSFTSMLLLMPCLLGEGSLTLWLLFAGVDAAKWEARAALAHA
ncbi:MAG: hypothetical protein JWN66_5007 [Sphingomonas bacterium]|uniref:DUF4386 domain-containing protein n=1 Tax=Sphingomonas bacterium TaxID=1895847 RepID=UPI00260AE1F2|nr:DUF4386 domain-containing protein [Sphingomonas bacterium]MDB5707891.1 hypothetical protein [Sphingomonas bacterium]